VVYIDRFAERRAAQVAVRDLALVHAATRSISVGSSLGVLELFTRRDTVQTCQ
jgi:hypothetical protein